MMDFNFRAYCKTQPGNVQKGKGDLVPENVSRFPNKGAWLLKNVTKFLENVTQFLANVTQFSNICDKLYDKIYDHDVLGIQIGDPVFRNCDSVSWDCDPVS